MQNLYVYRNAQTGEVSIVRAETIEIDEYVERIKIIRNGNMFMENITWRIGNTSFYKPLTANEKVELL